MARIGDTGSNLHRIHVLQHDQQQLQPQPEQPQPSQRPQQSRSAAANHAYGSEPSYSPHYMALTGNSGAGQSNGTSGQADVNAAGYDAPAPEGSEGSTATEVTQDSVTNTSAVAQDVAQASDNYDAAKAAVDGADKELQAQLAEIGPSLTDDQKQEYIAAYHAKHSDVYDAEAEAAAGLEAKLSDPTIVESARNDPAVAEQIQDALAGLAAGNHGQAVLDWLETNLQASTDFGFNGDDYAQLVTDAVNSASAAAATSTDPTKALNDVVQSLDQLKSLTGAPAAILDAADVMAGLQEAIAGGASAVEAFFSTKGYEPDANPKLMAAAYLMTMAQASNQLIQGLDASDPKALIDFGSKVATLAQGGAEKVAAAAKNGSEFLDTVSKRINSSLGSLASNAEAVAKIMHAAGGALGAISAVVNFADYLNDPNANGWDGIKAIGSLMAAVPVPWIATLGNVLSAISEIGSAITQRNGRAEEQAALLQEIGVSAGTAHAIAGDPSAGAALAEAGLSPEQIQKLASKHPGLFEPTNHGAEAFAKAVISMELSGEDAVALADAMSSNGADDEIFSKLADNAASAGEPDGLMSGAAIAEMLANPTDGSLFEAAGDYLEKHHPEVAQAAADRQDAVDDFNLHQANVQGEFGSNLAEHESEAYRVEVIAQAKHAGSLEGHVQDVAYSGSKAEKEAVAQALTAAYNAGVIDYETANEYIEALGQPSLPKPAD